MSKIKEELLNNLSDEEMEAMYGISAFEYVEYMEKYRAQKEAATEDTKIDEDVVYQQYLEQEKLNEQYWEYRAQESMDRINAIYETRFCYADCFAAIVEVTGDEMLATKIGNKLNELYIRRLTFDAYELQSIQMVDKGETK